MWEAAPACQVTAKYCGGRPWPDISNLRKPQSLSRRPQRTENEQHVRPRKREAEEEAPQLILADFDQGIIIINSGEVHSLDLHLPE